MKIAENLKRLRRERDLTQEELAAYIGITAQAVSKWESGAGLPDITLVPTIAGFFGVTTDELFGMDELRSEENLYNAFKRTNELAAAGKFAEAIELNERTLKIFPENASLMAELGGILAFVSDDANDTARAAALCERSLRSSPSEKSRASTRARLGYIYAKAGDAEKAENSAATLPHFWESREFNVPELLSEPERGAYLREKIPIILSVICARIGGAMSESENLSALFLGFPPRGAVSDNAEMLGKIENFLK